ncbi:MAG: response regulator [Campylobacterales bacterium]
MKVLVVDDSKVARMTVIKVLTELIPEGVEIAEAGNGVDALASYKEMRPDLVFLDLTMPDMDGYEALGRLKIIDPDAVVYVVSADIQPGALERVMALGAKRHVPKPMTCAKMEEILKEAGYVI